MEKGEGIDMSDPGIADEFARFMKETDPEGSKKLEQTVELANFDPKGRKKNATGGRAGYYTGGMIDVEPIIEKVVEKFLIKNLQQPIYQKILQKVVVQDLQKVKLQKKF